MEKKNTTSLSLENNQLEKIRTGIDQGTGFRVIHQNITYYGYINSLELSAITQLVREVCSAAKSGRPLRKNPRKVTLRPTTTKEDNSTAKKTALAAKIALMNAANKSARGFDNRIQQVTVSYGDTLQQVCIANTLGILAQDLRPRTRLVVQVVAQDDNILETGYESIAGCAGFEFFANPENNPEKIGLIAAQRAILNLGADHAPAGEQIVVLAGEAGGTMVHEACGHALEADFIQKKISVLADKKNKQIASPLITVIDDGTLPGHYGSGKIDDEGEATKKNILIENGKLTGFMNDYHYAKLLKLPRSGNGRRESYRQIPVPRMTNTYIAPGQSTYAEILSSVNTGILVKKMGGGQVDITNGNFVFEITEGYKIVNGKQSTPIRGATLVGNGITVLSTVDMVGNDLHFIPGTCGKGQAAPVTDGQPTLRIPQLIIGGIA